jgi:aryl-alcohol dehydrogenase-like predicted oxidoreductase
VTTETQLRTTLGRSGLDVTRIACGTWQLGGDWGSFEERDAIEAIQHARRLGINFFDTAQAYGFGESEALLAEALGDDIRRDDVIVATKGGLRPIEGGITRDTSAAFLRDGVEKSLRHLGVEAIDLYQVHWPHHDTPFEETGAALQELKDEGKIRHVGVSNFSSAEMEELSRTVEVETDQPPYNLFNRGIEADVLPWCREHDVGTLLYGPLSHGLLSGHFDPSRLADDDWRRGHEPFEGEALERNMEAVERLTEFAERRGHTLPQLAVAWVLAQPGAHVAIVGARRPAHVEGVTPAADIHLSDDELAEIDELTGAARAWGLTPEG